jgi:hypothetical protein
MSKRKIPQNPNESNDVDQALAASAIQDGHTSPPRRVAPKGSPADEFLGLTVEAPPSPDAQDLTCDLTVVPKSSYNKRRTLSAIIIGVLPIYTKAGTSHACCPLYCNVCHTQLQFVATSSLGTKQGNALFVFGAIIPRYSTKAVSVARSPSVARSFKNMTVNFNYRCPKILL